MFNASFFMEHIYPLMRLSLRLMNRSSNLVQMEMRIKVTKLMQVASMEMEI